VRQELATLLGDRVVFDEPLARHTSLRVGGPADVLACPGSRAELGALVELCRAEGLPLLLLGAGFNTLVRDAGVRGVVVRLGLRELRFESLGGDPRAGVRAEASATHSSTCRFAAEAGRAGLEFAVGIPGTVGGWLAMNAGIGSREMKDVVERVEWLDPATGIREVAKDELHFAYRHLERREGVVLLSALFATEPDAPELIRERMRTYMAQRKATQPVDELSCGSVFVNPPDDYAGRLIEAVGLKGTRAGGAEISALHANFIVNRGGARARDVLDLIERARSAVAERFDVYLQTEVKIVGEER
jgi:UDP-N-acetylmuramate dehydrogenase